MAIFKRCTTIWYKKVLLHHHSSDIRLQDWFQLTKEYGTRTRKRKEKNQLKYCHGKQGTKPLTYFIHTGQTKTLKLRKMIQTWKQFFLNCITCRLSWKNVHQREIMMWGACNSARQRYQPRIHKWETVMAVYASNP